ncbi:MAG: acetate--CoA ligase family protein [Proteobacteria bacterium]|nr:acetate--CoA ligase family protein [Pseudomonadota bacterium]MDA0845018.1 acetate--CoA ligase family protein [Pseudomonadota bacterium]
MPELLRLFQPKSIAVYGGSWAENVIHQCQKMGFGGDIWPVHPHRKSIGGLTCFASISELPGVPDAAFLGINRDAVIEVTSQLSEIGCGGAVCFASGFAESGDVDLQQQLVAAAGDMPLLGPNCYGFINYLDGALLWPDQHGGRRCDTGVALISQSSNIAINLGMQARGLPIGYVACVGNQAQTSLTDMTAALLDDPRITAAGLYIEGIDDAADLARLAHHARQNGKNIVAIKSGKTALSQQAAGAHTAALAGDAAASSAFLQQCGIIEVHSLDVLIETLKTIHVFGGLPGNRISAMCCSGGEAGLLADRAMIYDMVWPDIPAANKQQLADQLGPLVHLANPLDYHTFIWGDEAAMTQCFAGMMGDWVDLSCLVIDFPRADRCNRDSWMPAVIALQKAAKLTGCKVAVLSSMPEGLPDDLASDLGDRGVLPLCGFEAGLSALAHAASANRHMLPQQPWIPLATGGATVGDNAPTVLSESAAKLVLRDHGLVVPMGIIGNDPARLADQAAQLTAPLALKGQGVLHKSEQGYVVLGLGHGDLAQQAASMAGTDGFLVEEMVTDPIAELLVGIRRDPQYGIHLTLASGGIMTELWRDSQSLILPVDGPAITGALAALKLAPVLGGFRGRPAADIESAIRQILVLCDLITSDHSIAAIEINPLMITANKAVAADALLWRYDRPHHNEQTTGATS